jgi:hypothetical protein
MRPEVCAFEANLLGQQIVVNGGLERTEDA